MKKGFTLIELLVSIAIIALILSVAIISISNTNAKKRDAIRIANMNEIFKALSLYQNEIQKYPIYTGNITGSDLMSTTLQNADTISKVPTDPLDSYNYIYTSANGTDFTLGFCLETNTIKGYSQGCGNTISP
jgi:prepilin-type N-terminal cleavage/methylation domain-containing protein